MKTFYTVKEVAAILGCSTNTVYKYLEERKLSGVRIGVEGRFRIPVEELKKIGVQNSPAKPQFNLKSCFRRSLLQPKDKTVPSLFDFFIAILSFSLGFAYFILPSYTLERSFAVFTIPLYIFKGVICLLGFALITTDLMAKKKDNWHYFFHILLAISYFAAAIIFGVTKNYGHTIGYGLIAAFLIISLIWKVGEYLKFILLVDFLILGIAILYVFSPQSTGIPILYDFITQNRLVFAIVTAVFSLVILIFSTADVITGKISGKVFSYVVSLGAFSSAFFAFSRGYWERAAYIVVFGIFALVFPYADQFEKFAKGGRRLLAVAFSWIICLFVIGAGVMLFLQRTFLATGLTEVQKRLNTAVSVTRNFVDDNQNQMLLFAQDATLAKALDEKDLVTLNRVSKEFYLEVGGDLKRVLMIDALGEVLTTYPYETASVGNNVANLDYFQEVKAGKKIYVTDIYQPKNKELTPVVAIAAPVISKTGNFAGVLLAGLDLNQLTEKLNLLRLGSQGSFIIVDKKTDYIIHPEPEKILTPAEKGSAALLSLSSTGERRTYNTEGILSLQAYAPLTSFGWGLVAQEPFSEVFRPYSIIGFLVLIVLAILGTGILVLVMTLKRRNNV